ncbi:MULTISPECIES: hypothetical protein [unclassified Beijerinckia]|uniref:hypothetical protein n=1 Tax=unclassified Beijerinckia TaxID=2638183 RepID=UPI00089A29B7|nr:MULTISPECIES: hypothetical protein [unclassified Beijerinckia]MDH7799663.1 hypothetical protein [Beijerinckia sp. GAS462]SEB48922.1 hypothetical protein SAMN05443249_0155 [Beijerinckia sp. 28-YEA-48]
MTISSVSQMIRQERDARIDAKIGCALIIILCGVAIWLRFLLPMNTDTSWLITVSDLVLDGKKLYVDVSETNPPASVWIYLPIVALARLLHVAPEPLVITWIFALTAMSLGLAAAILARAGWLQRYDRLLLLALAIAIFTILPGNAFSEREHVATLFCLPFLAAAVARVEGRALSWPLLIAAGLCGGIVVIIKPHFVLSVELPVLVALAADRRWRTLLSPENMIAGLLTIAYVVSTFVFYSDYWTVTMPVNAAIYLPVARMGDALQSVYLPLLGGLILSAWLFSGRHFLRHPAVIVFAAAIGFCIAFVIQGKLWSYQIYPAISLGLMGAALVVIDRGLSWPGGWLRLVFHPAVVAAVTVAICAPLFFLHFHYDRLVEAIAKLHPHPTLAIVSGDIALGHPTTRMVNGRWGMTQWALWTETYGLQLRWKFGSDPAFRKRLSTIEAIEKADMATFLTDLRRNRPDILLTFRMETDLRAHIRNFPGIAEELDRYEIVDTVSLVDQPEGVVDILRRRPDAPISSDLRS